MSAQLFQFLSNIKGCFGTQQEPPSTTEHTYNRRVQQLCAIAHKVNDCKFRYSSKMCAIANVHNQPNYGIAINMIWKISYYMMAINFMNVCVYVLCSPFSWISPIHFDALFALQLIYSPTALVPWSNSIWSSQSSVYHRWMPKTVNYTYTNI